MKNTFGDAILKRAAQLHKAVQNVDGMLREISEGATIQAIRAAADKTPPTADGDLGGTDTRSGELKAHWAQDSESVPKNISGRFETVLANNKQYASYVDQGHRLGKHFVPGLVADPITDRLERSPDGSGGIVVGTKTQWVPGLYMAEAGRDAFEQAALTGLKNVTKKVLSNG